MGAVCGNQQQSGGSQLRRAVTLNCGPVFILGISQKAIPKVFVAGKIRANMLLGFGRHEMRVLLEFVSSGQSSS